MKDTGPVWAAESRPSHEDLPQPAGRL
jgi:hypothetical protein